MALQTAGLELIAEGAAKYISDIRSAKGASDEFVGAVESGAGRIATSGGKIDAWRELVTGALRRVGEVAVSAMLQAGKAVTDFVGDSIGVAADFESGMYRFQAVTGLSGDKVEEFSALFLKLGADTQYSAAQAQEAAINLAKGGIDPLAIQSGALADTLSLAAAGELELGNAAEIVAKQLGVWSDTGVTSAQVADLLANAANASTVDVEELALGLAQAGGQAKVSGVSFEDLVTTMAEIAPNFASASDAGTSFKTFLARLQPSTKEAMEAMQALGLVTEDNRSVFYDAEGNFVGMRKAAELLQEATQGLSEADKTMALNTIFGTDALRAAAAIAEGGAEGFDAMAKAMNATGGAAEVAAQKNKGFNFAMEQLSGSLETLQIVIGSKLLPPLTDLLNHTIVPGVNAITAFADEFTQAGDPVAFLAQKAGELLGPLGTTLGLFDTGSGKAAGLASIFNNLGGAVGRIRVLIGDLLPGAMETANTVMGTFSGMASQLWGVVQGVADQIARFVSNTVTGQDSLKNFANIFETARGIIEAAIQAMGSVVTTVLGGIQQFINTHGEEIQAALSEAWEGIQGIIQVVLDILNATVISWVQEIARVISTHGEELQQLIGGIWNIISNLVTGAIHLIRGILETVMALIRGDWEGAWETLKDTLEGTWEKIKGIVEGAIQAVSAILSTVWDEIDEEVRNVWNGIAGFIQGVWDSIVNSIRGAINSIIDAINGLIDGYNRIASALGLPQLGRLPHLARGVRNFPGGLAVVGERGPELVMLPRGSDVYPAPSAQAIYQRSVTYNTTYAPQYVLNAKVEMPMTSLWREYTLMQALAGGL